MKVPVAAIALCGFVIATAACRPTEQQEEPPAAEAAFEVWAADQNANVIYVLDPEGNVVRTIDGAELGGAERPHMLWGVPGDGHVYSTNTVSNSVTVLNRAGGAVVGVIEDVGKAPHAAQPNPSFPDRIYVSNIAPQAVGDDGNVDRGETITELVRSEGENGPSWEVARVLDLKADPALADTTLFPSRRPVCAGFSQDGGTMLVTLFNGGLAAIDGETGTVSRAWGNDEIGQYGCGFASSADGSQIYVTTGNLESSRLHVFDVSGAEPSLLITHELSERAQDAHGVYVDPVRGELWVVHRVSSNVTIHPLATIAQADHEYSEIPFVGKTPDLVAFSPDASRAFITLRGPNPAPTIPHATVGETPGVAIIDVETRELLKVVELGDPVGSDFHGIFVPAADG